MKYTDEQLREMARECLHAREMNDVDFHVLIGRLSERTGIVPMMCEAMITALAI